MKGIIRGNYREKIYSELDMASLQDKRWYRQLCGFYKILDNISQFQVLPEVILQDMHTIFL